MNCIFSKRYTKYIRFGLLIYKSCEPLLLYYDYRKQIEIIKASVILTLTLKDESMYASLS